MTTNDSLDQIVVRARCAAAVPGLAVAIGAHGQLTEFAAAGLADVDSGRAIGVSTPYRIGSITKTFTAAVVMLLADRGTVDIDASASAYLGKTPFVGATLRHLLAHNGGLPREAPTDMWESMVGPSDTELQRLLADVEVLSPPGVRWHYSNLGYAVLGQVVNRATGRPCTEVIDSELLRPLGLGATTWNRPDHAAIGYRLDPYSGRTHLEPDMDQKAIGVGGQLWSTLSDMIRWADALAGGVPSVLPAHIVDAMHSVHSMVDLRSWRRAWGLGLILERRPDGVLAGHTGAMPGFLSALWIDRQSRTAIAAFSNTTRGISLSEFAAGIADTASAARAVPVPTPAIASPCPPEIEPLLGVWWSESDETVLTWRDGALHAHLAADATGTDTRFRPDGANRFRAAAGRLMGEVLVVDTTDSDVGFRWATYPFTRSPS